MRQLYLDYNATTPIAPTAQQAMLPFLAEQYGNPSSSHALGRAANEAIEDAREYLGLLVGCDPEELVFTGGGTESNNLVIKGVAFRRGMGEGAHVSLPAIEQARVVERVRFLERFASAVPVVPVNGQGVVQPPAVGKAIRNETVPVSIMLANSEVGALQPIKQMADICRA